MTDDDSRTVADTECVCGELATTTVTVQWMDGPRRYRYCEACADAVTTYVEGATVE